MFCQMTKKLKKMNFSIKLILVIILLFSKGYSYCQGDINNDNVIDYQDISLGIDHIMHIDLIENNLFELLDFNSDQKIDIFDLLLQIQLILNNNILCGDCPNPDIMCLDIHSVFKQLTPLPYDTNGFYHFNYAPTGQSESDYGTVYYFTTNPLTRVGWYSPDSFLVVFMGQEFWEPVINFSTYSDDQGQGQQLFYVNSDLIGDTLDIYGYYFYHPEIMDSVKVIIGD